MPKPTENDYRTILTNLAENIDIPPAKYQKAVERYTAVGKWLKGGIYEGAHDGVTISPQGSFLLGTITAPHKNAKNPAYDIDLVCQPSTEKKETSPETLKTDVGNRLKENGNYNRMLDDEGTRCWTLEYAEEDGIGFHLDVLPAILEDTAKKQELRKTTEHPNLVETAIAITHRENNGDYRWDTSNPLGYAEWFKQINAQAFSEKAFSAREAMLTKHPELFASVEEVPDQLIRTPLQQVIQILKRHRDVRFSDYPDEKYKPISIIITTLAAQLYENEVDVLQALRNITSKIKEYSRLLTGATSILDERAIVKNPDGSWYIANPVNNEENFADRWHEDNGIRAEAFFEWASWVGNDLLEIAERHDIDTILSVFHDQLGEEISFESKQDDVKKAIYPAIITPPPLIEIQDPPMPWLRTNNI